MQTETPESEPENGPDLERPEETTETASATEPEPTDPVAIALRDGLHEIAQSMAAAIRESVLRVQSAVFVPRPAVKPKAKKKKRRPSGRPLPR